MQVLNLSNFLHLWRRGFVFSGRIFIRAEINVSLMMKTHISISIDEVDRLKLANQKFGCGDKVKATDLVLWAVQVVLAAYDHEA